MMINLFKPLHPQIKMAIIAVPPPLEEAFFWGDESWHKKRRAGHTASKIALAMTTVPLGKAEDKNLFFSWFSKQTPKSFRELSFYHLPDYDLLCSRSHNDDWALAATLPKQPQVLSLGVDIEYRDRAVKPAIQKFVTNKHDVVQDTQLIEIWCLKEAIFKACSSWLIKQKASTKLVLTDISLEIEETMSERPFLKSYLFRCNKEAFQLSGKAQIQSSSQVERDLLISCAILTQGQA